MSDDFNKSCAEASGCEVDDGLNVTNISKGMENLVSNCESYCGKTNLYDMHFHDSYDWAMLLWKSLDDNQKSLANIRIGINNPELEFIQDATPQQLSQACLEVLNAN